MQYRNGHLRLEETDIRIPHGGMLRRFPLVTHENGVIVVPIVRRGRRTFIMLLEQWRAAMDQRIWEVPGGGLLPRETARQAAVREVREEAGLEVDRLVEVGRMLPAPGWEVETQFHFIAECHPTVGPQALDATENMTRHLVPVARVRRMLRGRQIVDLKSKALLYDALDYLDHSPRR